MDRFVRIRMVKANAIDLTQFQFDFDLTFAAFLMNADGTIYGRFGSRSSRPEAMRDMSLESFAAALTGAIELHAAYPANRAALAAKRDLTPRFTSPEGYPSLKGKFKPRLDYGGEVMKSCLHCHQIGDAERLVYRSVNKPVPDPVLYPWPIPDTVGLRLDRTRAATVQEVAPNSAAARAGFRVGDEIVSLAGQPLISIADVQWVLHKAPDSARLDAVVRRDGRNVNLTLVLRTQWRRASDLTWRVTTWDLRKMAAGGLLTKDLPADERRKLGLSESAMALFVEHVGQYGDHAVAKRAGFLKGDIIVAFDGKTDRMTESQALAHVMRNRMPGSRMPVTVLRDGERKEFVLRTQ